MWIKVWRPLGAAPALGRFGLPLVLWSLASISAMPRPIDVSDDPRAWSEASDKGAEELMEEASKLLEAGRYGEALNLAEEALLFARERPDRVDPVMSAVLELLASIHRQMGNYDEAEPLLLESLAIREQLSSQDEIALATTLNVLGVLYDYQGRYDQAQPCLQRSLAIRERVLGPDAPDTATGLNDLAALYLSTGAYDAAEPLLQRALSIRERVLGSEHPDVAATVNNLAALYYLIGAYERAEPLYQRCLALEVSNKGYEHPDTALCLNNLAALYRETGAYEKAEQLFLTSIGIRKRLLGPHHPDLGVGVANLAALYLLMGAYERAEPLFREGLEICERSLGPYHPETANALGSLGVLYRAMEAYPRAVECYRRSLSIFERVLGEENPRTLGILNSLAVVLADMGQLEDARVILLKILSVRERVLGSQHPATALSMDNLAGVYRLIGDPEEALPLLLRSLEIRERTLGGLHRDVAFSLNNLAGVYALMGSNKLASDYYRRSISIFEQALGPGNPETANVMGNLSRLYLSMGDDHLDEAQRLAARALQMVSDHFERSFPALSSSERLRLQKRLRSHVSLWLTASREGGASAQEAWVRIAGLKGITFLHEAALSHLTSNPEGSGLVARYRKSASHLSAAQLSQGASGELEILRARHEALEKQVSARLREETLLDHSPDQLISRLEPGTALVDFIEYREYRDLAGTPGRISYRVVAFIIRPGRPIQRIELGERDHIASLVARWRSAALQSPDVLVREETGRELSSVLWVPLEPFIDDVETVLLSPDGALNLLPFAALPGSVPGRYLLEDYALSLLPVPTAPPARSADGKLGTGLLAVGDVDYGAAPGAVTVGLSSRSAFRTGGPGTFTPLPQTGPEVESVERLFRRARVPGATISLTGASATESALKAQLPRGHYVHMATHGFVNEPDELPATREVSGIMDLRIGQGADIHPGLQAGLALAGANYASEPGQDDGILTALEVATLDLHEVELVVMSACETALGASYPGEGLIGLQRAFQAAGVATTVSTLWRIDDEVTRLLMSAFYRNLWVSKMSKVEALRAAQLMVMREGRLKIERHYYGATGLFRRLQGPPKPLPPYYWAAFVMAGAWE